MRKRADVTEKVDVAALKPAALAGVQVQILPSAHSKNKLYLRKYRLRKIENGICEICNKPQSQGSKRLCDKHLENARARDKKYLLKRNAKTKVY